MMRSLPAMLFLTAFIIPLAPLHAADTQRASTQGNFTSLAAWQAAAPGETKELTFAGMQAGIFLESLFLETHKLTFDSLDRTRETSLFVTDGVGVDGQGPSQLFFSEPVVGVAVDFPDGMRIEAYNSENERVYNSDNHGERGATGQFLGAIFDEPVKDVLLFDFVNNLVLYDNLYIAYAAPDCPDNDGDGFTTCDDEDCDDTNATTNPSAEEILGDGIDNNCNGEIDEGGCETCALFEGDSNPTDTTLSHEAGAEAILLHFGIKNESLEDVLDVGTVAITLSWPVAHPEATVALSVDEDCDGEGEGDADTADGLNGRQLLAPVDTIPADESHCYVVTAQWDELACPGCGAATASVRPIDVGASIDGKLIDLEGSTVTGALSLSPPEITIEGEPEAPLDPGGVVDLVFTLDDDCPEAWQAEVLLCEQPDGALGADAAGDDGSEGVTLSFEEDGTLTIPLTVGDRPGDYTVCVLPFPAEVGLPCEGVEALTATAQVSGLTLLARHDGDPTEGIGTFLSGIAAPNIFEMQLRVPDSDPRALVRVDFDLDGVPLTVTQAPFATTYDMATTTVQSVLTVSAELSDGTVVDEVYELLGLPVAEWIENLSLLGATVDKGWEPDTERYAISVQDFPNATFSFPVPEEIPLFGGTDLSGELTFDIGAGFHISRATDFVGAFTVDGRIGGEPYTTAGEINAAFDPDFKLLPGAIATARTELDIDFAGRRLRVEEVPLLGTTLDIETTIGGLGRFRSAGVATFDQQFNVEEMTFLPQLDAFFDAITPLSGQLGVAEALVNVKVCAAIDGKLSFENGATQLTQEHFGGVSLVRVDLLGSVFWQGLESAGHLGGVTLGPNSFGDGTLVPGGSTLSRCTGETELPAFFPRAALAADGEGQLVLVRTANDADDGEEPFPEIVSHFIDDDGLSEEIPITSNGRWEMDPDVTFVNGGQALTAWTTNIGDPSLTDLGDILDAQEIAIALWNGEAWGEETLITDDDAPDGAPQVAYNAASDTAMILWLHHDVQDDGAIASLRYRIVDGTSGALGPMKTLPAAEGDGLHSPRVATGQGRFVVMWIASGEEGSEVLFSVLDGESWSVPMALSEADGRAKIAPTLTPRHDGDIAALFVSQGDDGDRLEIARLQPGLLSADAPEILDTADTFIRSPQAAFDSDGRATVAFRKRSGDRDALFALTLNAETPEGAARALPQAVGASSRQLTFDRGVSGSPTLAMADGQMWLAWSRTDRDQGERGGLAERLRPGIRLAPVGGAERALFTGERRIHERLGEGELIASLELELELGIRSEGRYSLQGRLLDRNGRALSTATLGPLDLSAADHTLSLEFDGREIREGGLEGPFRFADVALIDHRASPMTVAGTTFEDETGPIPLDRFLPSRLDTGRSLFTGDEDAMTLTVNESRFEGNGSQTVTVYSSALAEPRAFELPEVSPGRFELTVPFSTEPTVEGSIFVEPAGVVRPSFIDPDGREWSSPVNWVPPSPIPHALEVDVSPPRSGKVRMAGIDCPRDCYETVNFGQRVTLVPEPAEGYELLTFTGACNGPGECSFIMTEDSQVSARFREVEETPIPDTPTPLVETPPPATEIPTAPEASPIPPSPAPETPGPSTEAPTQTPGAQTPAPTQAPTPTPTEDSEGDGGCGCMQKGRSAGGMSGALMLMMLGVGLRRRRS